MKPLDNLLLRKLLLHIPADYLWSDAGIVRIGAARDIAAYAIGDFRGKCLIFCHGNGETAVSERYWFEQLSKAGVSVICPDYRGYGLSIGELSEEGCYVVAHAAYAYLVQERQVSPRDIVVLGYSLGSAVAVELSVAEPTGGLILQTPFADGRKLLRAWASKLGRVLSVVGWLASFLPISCPFPTSSRLGRVSVPVLVIHGTADSIVPYSHGLEVFRRITVANKRFVSVDGAGHCNLQYFLGEKYVPLLVDFIQDGEC